MAEYRIVKIEDCEGRWPCTKFLVGDAARCVGCRGDGTRMVDVARVERWGQMATPLPGLVFQLGPTEAWVEVES